MKKLIPAAIAACMLSACDAPTTSEEPVASAPKEEKVVIYQVFTRLFGNTNTTNAPWGTIEQNGVGKFSDFTPEALESISKLGTTHVWYTGVPHHAVINDYTELGTSLDDPDVVKGRAGSPYAVKDYYSVNPDLANDPSNRLAEFDALIERTHDAGMKVIIDIVPNHVARNYASISAPEGVEDFGASDDTSVEYAKHNNFYYIPGEAFQVPEFPEGHAPLNGENHPLADGQFDEFPAKWTGNGSRAAQPSFHDWYETVKVNFGVRPDGSYDFPTLPANLRDASNAEIVAFWNDIEVPNSWVKFKDITFFWLERGVDGFRFDMAEMVPVEFWSYLNANILVSYPETFLLSEIYQPPLYRDFIEVGRMTAIYDKVGFYDSLKAVMQNRGTVTSLLAEHEGVADIADHMLHFLENHDEQRIASNEFAGDARLGRPAMLASVAISRSPSLIYFGQEVGEDGMLDAGFGTKTRTTIFDYWGVPAHQRFMNDGAFDGGQSTDQELKLRAFYETLMQATVNSSALLGEYQSLHALNLNKSAYTERQLAFARWSDNEQVIAVSNFAQEHVELSLSLPNSLIEAWSLNAGDKFEDALSDQTATVVEIDGQLQLQLSVAGHHGALLIR